MDRELWPNPEELDQLNKLFNFPYQGVEQDWEIEFADPGRVDEFIAAYEGADLNLAQKLAVMDLIIASYDELLDQIPEERLIWDKIAALLRENADMHAGSIRYWSCHDVESEKGLFGVSYRMREI